jgi:hypothetical protein
LEKANFIGSGNGNFNGEIIEILEKKIYNFLESLLGHFPIFPESF